MNHFTAGQIKRMKLVWAYMRNVKKVDKTLSNIGKPGTIYFHG